MLEKINGIVMKSRDYGETHKIVTIFSKKFGKITALARGAKKPKSRMAAVTQPFIFAQFFIYMSKGLSTIQQGEIINSNRIIREDIIKTAYTAYIMELTDKLLEDRNSEAYIFEQLQHTMDYIAGNENCEIPVIMYEMKLYKIGGFAPKVDSCVNCGKKEELVVFSIKEGGILCSRCRHVDLDSTFLPTPLPKLLYIFSEIGLERVNNISVKDENKNIVRQILDSYYDHYGGYYIKARKFLNQIDLLK
ncbi:DNA repair protein RecO [Oceanobacillus sp. Castelsardo]|uniref:DNA repair protein RecO n=1 Tax=Oceanobacillus sp. Castelsardo TaxID=1851204 RepID=UPI000839054B|nr:DNA repair protein RecO [Oceanobacillus sp. Castelsardo]